MMGRIAAHILGAWVCHRVKMDSSYSSNTLIYDYYTKSTMNQENRVIESPLNLSSSNKKLRAGCVHRHSARIFDDDVGN
jgi:hypothetical protein